MFQIVPIAPCPVIGHYCKEPSPIILTPTLQIFIGIYEIPPRSSRLQAEQTQVSQPFLTREMLQSPDYLGKSPLDLLKQFPVLKLGEPKTGHSTPKVVSLGQRRGGG